MPRPVKSERPVIAEPVVEPIQSTTIVVIHPGSSTLHIGRVTDHFPQEIPHVIARKITDLKYLKCKRNPLLRPGVLHKDSKEKEVSGLKSSKTIIHSMRINGRHPKPRVSTNEICAYNSNVRPLPVDNENLTNNWTDISQLPEYLVGDQVLSLQSSAPYNINWPIKHGRLNIHNDIGGSITSVLEDIQTLWSTVIEKNLDIPLKDLTFYRAVLLIPDNFNRNHVKLLVDMLLNRLRFSCVIPCQESVCGAFGSGLASAFVIDVGAEKTSLCCVEDGISIPNTRLTLNYGGNDITRCFQSLLLKCNFPYKAIDIEDPLDRMLLQELKETFCHLSMNIPSGHVHEFQVMRPNERSIMYKIKLGDEPLLAPAAMFSPDLFGILDEQLIETFPEVQDHDPEDLTDDRYLLEKKDVDTKKSKENTDADPQQGQSQEPAPVTVSIGVAVPKEHSKIEHLRFEGMPLDEAVMYCIEKCSNIETKKKMYSTVLLIGGGLSFKGVEDFLLARLQALLPPHYQYLKEQMEVINRPKENDPRTACWKGGTVLSILDSSQELWISQNEWNKYGVRILRERCAFQFSTNIDKQ